LHLLARVWFGARLAYAAAANGPGCGDVSLCCRTVLPVESILAQTRRNPRLAGVAGAVGAARMAARVAALRLSVAVDRLRDDRFALGGLGAFTRRVWRDLGRGVDIGGNQRGLYARRAAIATLHGTWRRCVIARGPGIPGARAVDAALGATHSDRRGTRRGAPGSKVAG